MKPDPLTDTAVPADPLLGERTIFGITVKDTDAPVVEVPLGYVVTLNSALWSPAVDPEATLNPACRSPLLG